MKRIFQLLSVSLKSLVFVAMKVPTGYIRLIPITAITQRTNSGFMPCTLKG